MAKYRVYMRANADLVLDVEADSEDEALDLAYEKAPPGICASCSGWGREFSLDLGEFFVEDEANDVEEIND